MMKNRLFFITVGCITFNSACKGTAFFAYMQEKALFYKKVAKNFLILLPKTIKMHFF